MRRKLYFENLWRWKCNLKEIELNKKIINDIDELNMTEWSDEFEQLMRNRLKQGSFRYGKIKHHGSLNDKAEYDRIDSAIVRLQKYIDTGNTEYLVDVSNMMLLEYIEGKHPLKHFASIDDGEHTKIKGEKK